MTIKAFVTGWPVKHSLSPKLHSYWLDALNIEGYYKAIGLKPEQFKEGILNLAAQGYAGGNVTIPHKESALKIADEVSDVARAIGAANTLVFKDGSIFATNTDAYGFIANITATTPITHKDTAIVLGAGGAARAIVYALQQEGFDHIIIANRTLSKAESLAQEFNAQASEWDKIKGHLKHCDLLVNTTSLGMNGENDIKLDLKTMPKHAIVNDIVYTPLQTGLLRAAHDSGLATVDGLGMLLHQAVEGFSLWFGKRPQVTEELRQYIITNL